MIKKRIFLLISFFLVAGFLFGLIIFSGEKLFFYGIDENFQTFPVVKNKINRAINNSKNTEDISKIICQENWEKYNNDVLGIGFCYPKNWGEAYVDPIKDLTFLEGAVDEYSVDENNAYSNSLFIKFKSNQNENSNNKVELRIFNDNYRGEHYPNSLAYDKGYADNVDKLKESGNICDYEINFTELWQNQGRMTEFWSECNNGIKTRIVNHEQYFDKALYSYDLASVTYLKLQNNFFDNVLIKKPYLRIDQVEKKINKFEEIFEAKNYPSSVDNSGIISAEEFEKQREEFTQFISNIYSYAPIAPAKKDFVQVEGEDQKVTVIRKYYWLLENQNLEEAYKMQNRTNATLDDFKFTHKKTRLAKARDFEKLNDNTFKFFVDYQDHNKPQTIFRITARVLNNDEKIEVITIEEITTEMTEYGGYKAYAKKQNGKNYVILEKYGIEIMVDEGMADYKSNNSNLNEVKFFGDIGFSKDGNYLMYRMSGWEWAINYIYDISEGKKVFEFNNPQAMNFDKDGKNLFICSGAGISGGATGNVYSVPDFKKKFELFNSEKSNTLEVSCDYDESKNELIFIYDKDCASEGEEKDNKCRKYEVIYSFDENKMISSGVVE